MSSKQEGWGSRMGLVLAMAGNAVGLGNFLRFPVQAVQNGGGAFIIPYIICFLLMGIPLLWIEWSTGRFGGLRGAHSPPFILASLDHRKFWRYFGVFGIFTNVAIAAYYCYIESWTMAYVYHSVVQTFHGESQTWVADFFNRYVDVGVSTTGIPYEAVIFYVLCLALNTWILSRGLRGGIEKVSRIGVPLLLIFAAFLAIRGITLGDAGPPGCTDCNSFLGLNYLWEPKFESLADPKVWLAAAGQIFFTLGVGMGSIQCYASFVRKNDDIALNAMTAGWMNGFAEVVLGAALLIPIAVGYLGLDWVKEHAGFSMAFQTMPYLFDQWGAVLGALGGVFWFGLLFFAGITSSLAMGTPWVSFMRDEFNWETKRAALSFGAITLLMGLPTVFFFKQGVFDEYDYWTGTVALVVFGLAQTIVFGWLFGLDKGWAELTRGADMRVPNIYRPIIKYVTPALIMAVFLGALVKPVDNDWLRALSGDFVLADDSIIGKIYLKEIKANRQFFAEHLEAEQAGEVTAADTVIRLKTAAGAEAVFKLKKADRPTVTVGANVEVGDTIAEGAFRLNKIFYLTASRLLLMCLFVFVGLIVLKASIRRRTEGRFI